MIAQAVAQTTTGKTPRSARSFSRSHLTASPFSTAVGSRHVITVAVDVEALGRKHRFYLICNGIELVKAGAVAVLHHHINRRFTVFEVQPCPGIDPFASIISVIRRCIDVSFS